MQSPKIQKKILQKAQQAGHQQCGRSVLPAHEPDQKNGNKVRPHPVDAQMTKQHHLAQQKQEPEPNVCQLFSRHSRAS